MSKRIHFGAVRDRQIARQGRYSKRNPALISKHNATHIRKMKSQPHTYALLLLRGTKTRAKKFNVPHNITAEDIKIPTYCPVFGTTLRPLGKRGERPSVDRLVPELGYVVGNIVVISLRANQLKNNATAAQHRRIAEYMESGGLALEPEIK